LRLGDIYLVKDCVSAVPGFVVNAEASLMDMMKAAGVEAVTLPNFYKSEGILIRVYEKNRCILIQCLVIGIH
jgi:hypothetical protein